MSVFARLFRRNIAPPTTDRVRAFQAEKLEEARRAALAAQKAEHKAGMDARDAYIQARVLKGRAPTEAGEANAYKRGRAAAALPHKEWEADLQKAFQLDLKLTNQISDPVQPHYEAWSRVFRELNEPAIGHRYLEYPTVEEPSELVEAEVAQMAADERFRSVKQTAYATVGGEPVLPHGASRASRGAPDLSNDEVLMETLPDSLAAEVEWLGGPSKLSPLERERYVEEATRYLSGVYSDSTRVDEANVELAETVGIDVSGMSPVEVAAALDTKLNPSETAAVEPAPEEATPEAESSEPAASQDWIAARAGGPGGPPPEHRRDEPASQGQLDTATKLGVELDEGVTKGEASDAISAALDQINAKNEAETAHAAAVEDEAPNFTPADPQEPSPPASASDPEASPSWTGGPVPAELRDGPATAGQKKTAEKLGVKVPEGATRGEASDLITEAARAAKEAEAGPEEATSAPESSQAAKALESTEELPEKPLEEVAAPVSPADYDPPRTAPVTPSAELTEVEEKALEKVLGRDGLARLREKFAADAAPAEPAIQPRKRVEPPAEAAPGTTGWVNAAENPSPGQKAQVDRLVEGVGADPDAELSYEDQVEEYVRNNFVVLDDQPDRGLDDAEVEMGPEPR